MIGIPIYLQRPQPACSNLRRGFVRSASPSPSAFGFAFWLFQKLKLFRFCVSRLSASVGVACPPDGEGDRRLPRARDGHRGVWAWPWGDAPRPRAGLTRDLTGL